MRLAFLVPILLVLHLAAPLASGDAPPEQVTPITPHGEQRVDPVAPGGEQHVEVLDPSGVQQVTAGTKNPVHRAADAVAKVVIVVVGAAIAVGTTIAGVLFF